MSSCAPSPYEAAEGADAVVLVTEWDALRALDLERLAASMRAQVLVDLRNIYPPEEVEERRPRLARHRPAAARALSRQTAS